MIMTPGLGFFYGGMVKRSNMLSTITYCFIIFAEITIIWYLIGFSLVFGPSNNGFIGDLEYAVLENVGSDPNPYYATTIPFGLFFFYQLKFAGITPALIIGAIVDRVKLLPLLVFVLFWIIYFIRMLSSLVWMVWIQWGLCSYIRFFSNHSMYQYKYCSCVSWSNLDSIGISV
jgi:Amt family ammonium transporter